jgi:hypothetical protein
MFEIKVVSALRAGALESSGRVLRSSLRDPERHRGRPADE